MTAETKTYTLHARPFRAGINALADIKIELGDADLDAYNDLPNRSVRFVKVTDQATGKEWEIRRAACGLGCRCAAEARPV